MFQFIHLIFNLLVWINLDLKYMRCKYGVHSFLFCLFLHIDLQLLFQHSSQTNRFYVEASRVIEMNDRLVDVYPNDKRSFLIKFYAPWCHHCQELGLFHLNVVFKSVYFILFYFFQQNLFGPKLLNICTIWMPIL